MSGRDHSETCDVCGFERGGLDDVLCACDLPWAVSMMTELTKLRDEVARLRATLAQPHMTWAADQHSVGVDPASEDTRLRAEVAKMRPIVETLSYCEGGDTIGSIKIQRSEAPDLFIAGDESYSALYLYDAVRRALAIDAAESGR